jgi:hypothetical protein
VLFVAAKEDLLGRHPGGVDSGTPAAAQDKRAPRLAHRRAHRWRELLEQGRYRSICALARELGVDNSYVACLLRLTLLAPDIIEVILDGTEPGGLSLEKLFRVPMAWEGLAPTLFD